MADETSESNSRINWKTIVVTALITGTVTIIANLFLNWFQAKEPKLVYTLNQTIPFPGVNEVVGIYQINIANEGKKEVDLVNCVIQIPNSSIKEKRVLASPSIISSDFTTNDTLNLSLSSLNPDEKIQISILASSSKNLPSHPEVSLRAKGLTGVLKSENANSQSARSSTTVSLVASIFGSLVGFSALVQFFNRNKGKITPDGKHKGDQRKVLTYLCLLYGLDEEASRYQSPNTRETEFWIEADRLALNAIRSKSKEVCEKTKCILFALPKCSSMAESSIAITLLNAAKIDLFLGNRLEAKKLADKAVAADKHVTEVRKSVDKEIDELLRET